MDLKPIIADLNKQAFTIPGLNAYELVPLHEVIQILEAHLGDVEEMGSALIGFPDGRLVERSYAGKEKVIKEASNVKAEERKPEENQLPPEILAGLDALGPSAVDELPGNGGKTPPGTAPAGLGNG